MDNRERRTLDEMREKIAAGLRQYGWRSPHMMFGSGTFGWYAAGYEEKCAEIAPHIIVYLGSWCIDYATPDGIEEGRINISNMLSFDDYAIITGDIDRIVSAIRRLSWVIGNPPMRSPFVSLLEAAAGAAVVRVGQEIGFGEYEPKE